MSDTNEPCWKYMKCGREPRGTNVDVDGICPATSGFKGDGTNQGISPGRHCWLVAGTFCKPSAQGTFSQKKKSCMECDYYKKLHSKERMESLLTNAADIVSYSHIGNTRKSNDDRYIITELEDSSLLLAIADGMGGEVAGDYAAETATAELAALRYIDIGNEQGTLYQIAQEIDRTLSGKVESAPHLEGMGTTLTCLFLRDRSAYWVTVGDSRLYLYRGGTLTQLTTDQTLGQFLVDEGDISQEELHTHYSNNILDQCIGCGFVEPVTGQYDLKKNDLLILSTDGLHSCMLDEEMVSILITSNCIEDAAKQLVDTALDNDGTDNISLVITEII